jgi:predicted transcriptional regulator
MGDYQKVKAGAARQAIYNVLSDGQWHRTMELKKTTQLSSRTLAKHLENLMTLKLIERKEDTTSGEYPIPVFYKAIDQFLHDFLMPNKMRQLFKDKVSEMLEETNDPLIVLEMIQQFAQVDFIRILEEIKNNKKMSGEELVYLYDAFLLGNFQSFSLALTVATYKMIDKIDINKMLFAQAKRQQEIWRKTMKRYEELGLRE